MVTVCVTVTVINPLPVGTIGTMVMPGPVTLLLLVGAVFVVAGSSRLALELEGTAEALGDVADGTGN